VSAVTLRGHHTISTGGHHGLHPQHRRAPRRGACCDVTSVMCASHKVDTASQTPACERSLRRLLRSQPPPPPGVSSTLGDLKALFEVIHRSGHVHDFAIQSRFSRSIIHPHTPPCRVFSTDCKHTTRWFVPVQRLIRPAGTSVQVFAMISTSEPTAPTPGCVVNSWTG